MNNRKNKFFKAVKTNDYPYIEDYLKRGLNINTLNRRGYTGLQLAIFDNDIEMVDFLIQKGAKTDDMSCHFAAAMGRKEIVELLLKSGVDVNITEWSGRTPLHWAAQEGQCEIAELLIKNGANVNIQEEGQTPLYIASGEGHFDLVKILLEHGADIELCFDTTPFQIACAFENYEVASLLLENGANMDATDDDGRTALFYAKVRGRNETIEFLLANGADENIVDKYGISIQDLNDSTIRERLYRELY